MRCTHRLVVQESFQLPGIRGRSRLKLRGTGSRRLPPRSNARSTSHSRGHSHSPDHLNRSHKGDLGGPSLTPTKTKSSHLPAIAGDSSSRAHHPEQNMTLLNLPVDHDVDADDEVDPSSMMNNVEFYISESSGLPSPVASSCHRSRSPEQGIAAGASSAVYSRKCWHLGISSLRLHCCHHSHRVTYAPVQT